VNFYKYVSLFTFENEIKEKRLASGRYIPYIGCADGKPIIGTENGRIKIYNNKEKLLLEKEFGNVLKIATNPRDDIITIVEYQRENGSYNYCLTSFLTNGGKIFEKCIDERIWNVKVTKVTLL
jgi:hypothetical protein